MSNMFDYKNTESLYKTALDWPHITDPSLQDYALKFIFGEIDFARRKLSSNRSKRQPIEDENRRIFMLKSLASTIANLPTCDDYDAISPFGDVPMTPQKNALDAPTPSPDQVPGEVLKQSLHALNIAVRLRISDAYSQQEKHKMRVPIFEAITALEQHLKGEG